MNAIRLGEGGRNLLFGDKYGYVHTYGQKIWCSNVSALAAYSYKILLEVTGDSKYSEWARDGLRFSIGKMKKNGLFPYSELRPTVYISVYQPIIIFSLIPFLNGTLGKEFNISNKLKLAFEFLITAIRDDGSIKEPEKKCYAYLPSIVASLSVLKYMADETYFKKVFDFSNTFFQTKVPFLYISFDKKLYNGTMVDSHDVLMTEVLYWFSTMVDNNGL